MEVKWIKITTDMFDNRKIKHLRRLPDGNNIVLIWVMLLTMAGRCNANGMIFLTENIPYTPKMLADELDFEESTVRLALEALEKLGMIVTDSGFFTIAGWQKHQNVDGMDRIREQTRKRVERHRERQKLISCNVTSNATVTECNATEEETEEEIEEDIEEEKRKRIDYESIKDAYNTLCPSLPSVKSLSESRKKAIKARLNQYTVGEIKGAFIKAEKSDFLKGKNDRNWMANFDWIIKDANMAKVIDGNYDNRTGQSKANTGVPYGSNQSDLDDLF